MRRHAAVVAALLLASASCDRATREEMMALEAANPVAPLPAAPLGIVVDLAKLPDPPTPETVRLGRWLFYDTRLSKDGTVSCATCHRPEHAFSEPTPVSTGVGGRKGQRKSPPILNCAHTFYPHLFFWDGRAASLEEQALGPIENPVEMGNTHDGMLASLRAVRGYAPYFQQAFGAPGMTKERVAKAIADYERTLMSGNSPVDRFRERRDARAISPLARRGAELFWGRAACDTCHFGRNFTDGAFHNLGVGWDAATNGFRDPGRAGVTGRRQDLGAFKTPTLRDCTKHAPYMHDGSLATLREVVVFYNNGGRQNPHLDPIVRPLHLSDADIDALVALLASLEGEGYRDVRPERFPR